MTRAGELRYVLPPGWAVIPLERSGETARAIEAIVSGLALDDGQGAQLRRQIKAQLTSAAADAARAGGTTLALSVNGMGGVPIPASLVVTYLPAVSTPDAAEPWLAGDDVDTATLPAGHVVRRVRHSSADVDGTDIPALVVDYWVARPGGGVAHLAASTPLVEHADAMTELFDAILQTAEWRSTDGAS